MLAIFASSEPKACNRCLLKEKWSMGNSVTQGITVRKERQIQHRVLRERTGKIRAAQRGRGGGAKML